jgi:hypothetical protein
MPDLLIGGVVALLLGGPATLIVVRVTATRALEEQIAQLEAQVVAWQGMHNHQVASMDKRLADLEECAARAEEEARLVSHQLERISRSLVRSGDSGNPCDLVLRSGPRAGAGEVESGSEAHPGSAADREAALTAGGSW